MDHIINSTDDGDIVLEIFIRKNYSKFCGFNYFLRKMFIYHTNVTKKNTILLFQKRVSFVDVRSKFNYTTMFGMFWIRKDIV